MKAGFYNTWQDYKVCLDARANKGPAIVIPSVSNQLRAEIQCVYRMLDLQQHGITFGPDLCRPASDRTPMRANCAKSYAGEFHSERRPLLRESLKLPSSTRSKVLQVRSCASNAFLKDVHKVRRICQILLEDLL